MIDALRITTLDTDGVPTDTAHVVTSREGHPMPTSLTLFLSGIRRLDLDAEISPEDAGRVHAELVTPGDQGLTDFLLGQVMGGATADGPADVRIEVWRQVNPEAFDKPTWHYIHLGHVGPVGLITRGILSGVPNGLDHGQADIMLPGFMGIIGPATTGVLHPFSDEPRTTDGAQIRSVGWTQQPPPAATRSHATGDSGPEA